MPKRRISGTAEVGDDTCSAQRLRDRVGLRMPEGDLAAALRRFPRARHHEPMIREPIVREVDQQFGEASRLGGDILHLHAVEARDTVKDGAERQDRCGVPTRHFSMPSVGR